MCLGRGQYDIVESSIREGISPISQIKGTNVEIYGPNTSPNSGDSPQLRVGNPIREKVANYSSINAVSGQILRAPNELIDEGEINIKFLGPNQIISETPRGFNDVFDVGDTLDLRGMPNITDVPTSRGSGTLINNLRIRVNVSSIDSRGMIYDLDGDPNPFEVGQVVSVLITGNKSDGDRASDLLVTQVRERPDDFLDVSWRSMTSSRLENNQIERYSTDGHRLTVRLQSTASLNFNRGDYKIASVGDSLITVETSGDDNESVNALFTAIGNYTASPEFVAAEVKAAGVKWVGPFSVRSSDALIHNFTAPNGLFKTDGQSETLINVDLTLESTPINSDGSKGTPEIETITLEGRIKEQQLIGLTHTTTPTDKTKDYEIRCKRDTNTDLGFQGSIVDNVTWRNAYSRRDISQTDFGDVTTIHARTIASDVLGLIKERKLNLLATRRVHDRAATNTLNANKRADAVISTLCQDPRIGSRASTEIDFDSLYGAISEAEAYFGTDKAVEISYTFDQTNLTFEETISSVAAAIFCTAYRAGSVIKFNFNRATEDSVMLFNSRNKTPGGEVRSAQYGIAGGNDGIELDWRDPDEDDTISTLHYPVDQSAIKPRKIETLGIRNRQQAWLHANRAWNRLRYQNRTVEFTATEEANLLTLGDRILVTDNTRTSSQDGQVESQTGLELTLSDDVDLSGTGPYYIFLQHTDKTVESIQVTAGGESNQVVLARAPKQTLSLEDVAFAKATYQIVEGTAATPEPYLVTEKSTTDNRTFSITAINYDAAYYIEDGVLLRLNAEQGFINDSAFGGGGNATGVVIEDGEYVVKASGNRGITFNPEVKLSGAYSVAVWVTLTANNGVVRLLNIPNRALIDIRSTGFGIQAAAGVDSFVTTTLDTNTRYHLVGTFDGTSASFYVDGEHVDAAANLNFTGAPASPVSVEVGGTSNSFTPCKFNNLRLYNRALSTQEARRLYDLEI